MQILGLNETIDKLLAIANSVHWYKYVLRKEIHILRRALQFRLKIIGKKQATTDIEGAG